MQKQPKSNIFKPDFGRISDSAGARPNFGFGRISAGFLISVGLRIRTDFARISDFGRISDSAGFRPDFGFGRISAGF